jgi:DNA-binding transcriptional regulator YiaG
MEHEQQWTGPIYGQRGILAHDGERAQCHICGDYFGNLGGHITQVHGIPPEEYKELFGLNATTGLIGPALKEVRRQEADVRKTTPAYQRFVEAGERARSTLSKEERSGKGRRLRLQQRLDPRVQTARRNALARANEALRQRKEAGLYQPVGWGDRDPKEISARGRARFQELLKDPNWREAFSKKVSEARGGRLQVTCVICGKLFTEPHSHRRKKTCSADCLHALRQQQIAEQKAAVADDRARRLAEGRALGKLREEQAITYEEVARRTGFSSSHVSRIERGLNVPSDEALEKIAIALGGERPKRRDHAA